MRQRLQLTGYAARIDKAAKIYANENVACVDEFLAFI